MRRTGSTCTLLERSDVTGAAVAIDPADMAERRSRNRVRLGDAVTAARKRCDGGRGWTQAQLAQAARVSLRSVANVESAVKVSDKTLRALEEPLGWPPDTTERILAGGKAPGAGALLPVKPLGSGAPDIAKLAELLLATWQDDGLPALQRLQSSLREERPDTYEAISELFYELVSQASAATGGAPEIPGQARDGL